MTKPDKCQTCGWKWSSDPRKHICIDNVSTIIEYEDHRKTPRGENDHPQLGVSRAEQRDRRKAAAKLYSEGYNTKQISEMLHMSYGTVVKGIHEAEKKGLLTVRPRGVTYKKETV